MESPRGEWGGPRQDQPADAAPNRSADVSSDEPAEMTVISEPEAYAATEPVMASDQTPPVTPEPVDAHDETGAEDAVDRSSDDHGRSSDQVEERRPSVGLGAAR